MKINRKISNLLEQITLKKRIVFIFAVGTLIPFVCTALISYNAMSSILSSKLDSGVRSNLKNVQQSIESTIDNLNHVSQQLVIPGSVGGYLDTYLHTEQPYERAKYYQDIKTKLNEITFTNPGIGLTMYYSDEENRYLFNTSGVKNDFTISRLPLLVNHFRIANFGPHISNELHSNRYVFSVLRKVGLPERDDIYIYIESDLKLTQNILQREQTGEQDYYLILDNNGRIVYSQVDNLFQKNTYFEGGKSSKGLLNQYYWFKETSDQGWSIISLIPVAKYNEEKNQWVVQMIYLSIIFGVLSLSIAWLLWKMVYKPLQKFDKEINWMMQSDFQSETFRTRIPEFDYLLSQFRKMKNQISDLFKEVEQKEKRRADLEVEKLLYQINPHFLMNTLDTANWLAVMNDQKDISRLVTSLNRLLYYNLGKAGQTSTIVEEIETLKQYLAIQKFRYDFDFEVRIHTDDVILNYPVPRFILQPLVENAIYHGLSDEGYIYVEVRNDNHKIQIEVNDNGAGISEEDIEKLLNQNQTKQQKDGMGIGLNYVKRMLENHYEGKAKLEIKSLVGKGTSVFLTLPILEVEARD
ncbi:sensor histidine kinase [Metabacillus bambusae]|uniref:histidine kinase n=1 Tax=Metabacillus bambusae TaxID=2795218 RepID=A0ABS3N3Q4_9BACI|nr:histidine kinase [Metabacillus bambusae]MBO1512665.1 histidine kinase [Metabacillus bambusae]